MNENELSTNVIGLCLKIHRSLGPGLLETAYQECLCYELQKANFHYFKQAQIPIVYEDIEIKRGFIADLIIEDKLIIEIKSVENLAPVHYTQLLTYLRLTDKRLGLLINFNSNLLKDGIKRIVNNL